MKMEEQEKLPTLEESFSEIETVITQLEKGEITLEESFSLYQKGVERLKHCNRLLDTVEKKLQIVSADGEVREG